MRTAFLGKISFATASVALALAIALPAHSAEFQSKKDSQGQVMVTVTPQSLSSASETWRFDVRLNTHVAPITQDLAKVAVLGDGLGHEEKPTAWQGDPPGGHHRKGVLVFKPMRPMPKSINLKIRDVGGIAERTFSWSMSGK